MKLEEKWKLNYNLLEEYKEEHGDIDVPTLYVTKDIQLGRWLDTQRKLYKDNNLSEERIKKLNDLGMNWNVIDKYYKLLEEYKKEYGNIDVPTYYEVNGIKLGQWIRRMRAKFNLNKLDNINIEKLNNLGMNWRIFGTIKGNVDVKTKWDKTYDLLEEYKEKHGNTDVPTEYKVDNVQLGRWLNTQRNMYKDNKLSEERIKKLNDLEIKWNVIDKYYKLLEEYKKEYGNIDVPTYYEIDGIKLGQWVRRMRNKYRLNKLDSINIERLNNLGIKWNMKNKFSCDYYELLEKYKEEYGNIDVPKDYKVKDIQLGRWLIAQRNMYRENTLSEERIKKLNNLGIKWDMKNKFSWDYYYELLAQYKEEKGNVDVQQKYKVDNVNLGIWLAQQRSAYRGVDHRIITPEQIVKLNKLGIDWSPKDTKLLNKDVNFENNEKYQLILYKRMRNILRDLQLENINEIHNEEEQREIEKIIIKRLFR